MFTKLPDFKCSLAISPLPVTANGENSICVSIYGVNNPENYKMSYRGKKYWISGFHFTVENGEVFFRTTENKQVYTQKYNTEINGYAVHKFVYSSELTQAGKEYIAKIILKEINEWYWANKATVDLGNKAEGKASKLEKINELKEKIAKLEVEKAEFEKQLSELE